VRATAWGLASCRRSALADAGPARTDALALDSSALFPEAGAHAAPPRASLQDWSASVVSGVFEASIEDVRSDHGNQRGKQDGARCDEAAGTQERHCQVHDPGSHE
jgi:hypothetical protein